MKNTTEGKTWLLFRLIIPVFPEVNIFTKSSKSMTALGPLMVATVANKLWGWCVEVIDENNYRGPRNRQGLPDHQILQKENPATAVGFYCGLTSTMERVWQLAEFYHEQRVVTLAGGWHAHYCPEETLGKNIDLVVHGDGEIIIQPILQAVAEGRSFTEIPGVSFREIREKDQVKTNPPAMLEVSDLSDLPHPDFGLLRYVGKIKYYSIGRIRGCRMNCEFCSVKGLPRWASPRHFFETVNWLVETRKARNFFIVDDRLEEDCSGTLEFFKMVSEKYGRRLSFIVQVRLETAAKNPELLGIMKKAGVRVVCIGYESPVDEELRVMRKGYSSAKMLEWTKTYRRYGFQIHAMFIFGYPLKIEGKPIAPKELVKDFKRFIRKARFDTVQVLHPVPIVGTDLRKRLKREGKIFPLEAVPWRYYDGSYACFQPDNMNLRELQEIPIKLMKWFYSPVSFVRIPLKTIAFPVDYLLRGWERWRRDWLQDIVKYGGHLLIQKWQRRQGGDRFLKRLEGR